MKILFIFPRDQAYDSRTVREFPSGGTEKAVIFLGEAFRKLGHDVEWVTTLEQPIPHDWADVVITQEAELLPAFPNAKKVWWCHHFSDQPAIQRNAAFGRCFAGITVTLSDSQRDDFQTHLRLGSVVIGHGVWLDEVVQREKDPYRLIYASAPFRGLERIPELFEEIRQREPRATIAICSSMAMYWTPEQDAKYQGLFDTLRQMDGVELLGSLNQAELYREYAKASYFYYPNTWPETYCLAMDEAAAHGCFVATSGLAALGERTRLAGGYEPWFPVPDDFMVGIGQCRDWEEIARQWEREVLCP